MDADQLCRLIGFKVPLHEEEGEAVKCKAQKPLDFDDFESLKILDNPSSDRNPSTFDFARRGISW